MKRSSIEPILSKLKLNSKTRKTANLHLTTIRKNSEKYMKKRRKLKKLNQTHGRIASTKSKIEDHKIYIKIPKTLN